MDAEKYLYSDLSDEEIAACLAADRALVQHEADRAARLRRESARKACFTSYILMYGYD